MLAVPSAGPLSTAAALRRSAALGTETLVRVAFGLRGTGRRHGLDFIIIEIEKKI